MVTQRLHNFRVTILRNSATSGYGYPEITTKKKQLFFENFSGDYSRAYVQLIHEKNQSSKISCYCPFNNSMYKHNTYEIADYLSASDIISSILNIAGECRKTQDCRKVGSCMEELCTCRGGQCVTLNDYDDDAADANDARDGLIQQLLGLYYKQYTYHF